MGMETNITATGLRLWQLLFICGSSLTAVVIFLCCCVRFRIPRTKQEIEADYVRKKITRKFQKQLRMIQNSEMDEMDLKKALDRVRAEFKSDTESLAQSELYSGGSLSSAAGAGAGIAAQKQVSPHQSQSHSHIGTPSKGGTTTEHIQA
ncbi:uncharacterized protein LOC142317877 [Lycorma delicatula]|uniref:uncharacterized protein LOC142317877 n=1 Tax=Lycorma delicatula TaxID=130591 RepID=UPI003F50F5E1